MPIIGTTMIFYLARGHYERNHTVRTQHDLIPMAFGLGCASIPLLMMVLCRMPLCPFYALSLGWCVLNHMIVRRYIVPIDRS